MIDKNKKEIQFEQPSDILILVNRYLMLAIALVVLSILVLGYFFILKPKIESINTVETETTVTEERRQRNEDLLLRIKELEAEYQDILNNRQEDLEFLKKMIPDKAQTAELFLMADVLTQKHGFQLANIEINESVPDKKTVPVVNTEDDIDALDNQNDNSENSTVIEKSKTSDIDSILMANGIKSVIVRLDIFTTVSGDGQLNGKDIYDSFKDYLSDMENNIRLFDVQAVSFDSISAQIPEGVQSRYYFGLDLITYYQ